MTHLVTLKGHLLRDEVNRILICSRVVKNNKKSHFLNLAFTVQEMLHGLLH